MIQHLHGMTICLMHLLEIVCIVLIDLEQQTSSAVHNPQSEPPRPNKSPGATPIDPNALLHSSNTNPEQMYSRGEGSGYFEGLQDVQGMWII
jgi:hypothetical protein